MRIYLIITIFLLLPLQDVFAAQSALPIRFRHISREYGLSQSTVYDIARDSKGFMWFATQDGLNRFDGDRMAVACSVLTRGRMYLKPGKKIRASMPMQLIIF